MELYSRNVRLFAILGQSYAPGWYKNTESCVINYGFSSNWFKISRSVEQGDPLSPYLFILVAEIPGQKICQNTEIEGNSSWRIY